MNPLVSVIIPVYKTEKYLKNSVNSILTQSYVDLDVIIVDDGSPDSCPIICDELKRMDSRITVIHKSNGGLSSARNAGIENIKGKYVIFLDSDDILDQTAIEDMVKIAEDEESDAVIPNTYYKIYEDSENRVKATHFVDKSFDSDPKVFALSVLIGMGRARRSTAVLYSTQIITNNKICYPYGRISEDFFFNLEFLSVANKISLYSKPSLFNLKRNGSISSSYYENFFDTILEMDSKVEQFIASIDQKKYNTSGKRESLLFRNTLIFAINVMGDKNTSYHSRVKKCILMFKNEKFDRALRSNVKTPFWDGKVKRLYMKVSLALIKMRLYHMTCYFASLAARINAI